MFGLCLVFSLFVAAGNKSGVFGQSSDGSVAVLADDKVKAIWKLEISGNEAKIGQDMAQALSIAPGRNLSGIVYAGRIFLFKDKETQDEFVQRFTNIGITLSDENKRIIVVSSDMAVNLADLKELDINKKEDSVVLIEYNYIAMEFARIRNTKSDLRIPAFPIQEPQQEQTLSEQPQQESVAQATAAKTMSMSELKQAIKDNGAAGMNGYQTSLANVKNNLKEGESAVVLTNGNQYVLVTKEPDGKYGVVDESVNNGNKVIYSREEFNNLMSGKSASGVDGASGQAVTADGYDVNANNVKVLTNSKAISSVAQAGDGRRLTAKEMNAAMGTGADAVIRNIKAKPAETGVNLELMPSHFDTNKYNLSQKDRDAIKAFAQSLQGREFNKLVIEGHADSTGNDYINIPLSKNRAKAVFNELARNGVPKSKMTYRGYSSWRPIATNKTRAGRALNRRAEVFIK